MHPTEGFDAFMFLLSSIIIHILKLMEMTEKKKKYEAYRMTPLSVIRAITNTNTLINDGKIKISLIPQHCC